MIIKRTINDKEIEIELTTEEMRLASEAVDLDYHADDVIAKMQEMADSGEIPLTVEQMDMVPAETLKEFALDTAVEVEHMLGKNDSYFDAFWSSVEYVLTEMINWKEALPKLFASGATVG